MARCSGESSFKDNMTEQHFTLQWVQSCHGFRRIVEEFMCRYKLRCDWSTHWNLSSDCPAAASRWERRGVDKSVDTIMGRLHLLLYPHSNNWALWVAVSALLTFFCPCSCLSDYIRPPLHCNRCWEEDLSSAGTCSARVSDFCLKKERQRENHIKSFQVSLASLEVY